MFPNCRSCLGGNIPPANGKHEHDIFLNKHFVRNLSNISSIGKTNSIVFRFCFLPPKHFNQRQLNDLILNRQLSHGTKSGKSPESYKHPHPLSKRAFANIQCENELLTRALISVLAYEYYINDSQLCGRIAD